MTKKNNFQDQVLATLKESLSGLQVEEIADKLDLTRHTVAKYLEVLRAGGQIRYKKIGRAKIWSEISSTTIVRLLKEVDIPDILRIEQNIEHKLGLDSPTRMESLRETAAYHLQQGDPLMNLGAEVDGRLVGFVLAEVRLWEFGHGEKTGWIKILGVDPEFQGRGIGLKLGENLLEHFKRQRVKKVRTLVNWYEGPLITYFRSLGFDILNMIPLEKEL